MRKKVIFKLAMLLMAFSLVASAYGQTYSVGVGETATLNVPSVSLGYVDKAIWACSNSAISFVSKSTSSATIKVMKDFEGYAKVELVYVAKYVDSKGFTRANTYSKDFYVSCKNGSSTGGTASAATSISTIPEIKVAIGEKAKIHYTLYPQGSTAKLYAKSSNTTCFSSVTLHEADSYAEGYARNVGTANVSVYFYDSNDDMKSSSCKVTVYDPTWTEPQSMSVPSVKLFSVGEKKKIMPYLTPRNATTLYEYSTDASSVAAILNSSVYAKKEGLANIKVKTANGLKGTCTAVVVQDKTQHPGLGKALTRAAGMLDTAEIEIVE